MLEKLQKYVPTRDEPETPKPAALSSIRMLAAELLVVTGVGVTLDVLTRSREAQRDRIPGRAGLSGTPLAAVWGPALVAPLAAAAHVRQATTPGPAASRATRVLDSAVIGMGLAELLTSFSGTQRSDRRPSLAPLAFASVGFLGHLLTRRELEIEKENSELQRRNKVVERLVPRRKPRFDRIVVHV